MIPKKLVTKPKAQPPENREIAVWLREIRLKWPGTNKEFYKDVGVIQQTWDNYEKEETPVPAWVLLRAVRRYATSTSDLRRWMNLTIELPEPSKEAIAEAVEASELLKRKEPGSLGAENLIAEIRRLVNAKEETPDKD